MQTLLAHDVMMLCLWLAVNSDESTSLGNAVSITSYMFSKSPSSDSSQVSEDFRGQNKDGFQTLTKEERECVLSVAAAKNPEDLKLFQKYVHVHLYTIFF